METTLQMQFSSTVLADVIQHTLHQECKNIQGHVTGYLGDHVGGYLDEVLKFFFQDPVMPSQEPPADAKREEVDVPPDDTEDTDGSKTFLL